MTSRAQQEPSRAAVVRTSRGYRGGSLRDVCATLATAATMSALALVEARSASAITVNNTTPPGVAGFQKILDWGGWVVTVLGVIGMLAVGGTMILQHRRGEGGEHVGKLGMVLAGLIVAVAAGPVVTALDA